MSEMDRMAVMARDLASAWLKDQAKKQAERNIIRQYERALKWTRKHPRHGWPRWVKEALAIDLQKLK